MQDIPALGRAEDHARAAEVGAKVHRMAQVVGGLLARGRVWMVHVHALSEGQHPVNARDDESGVFGQLPDFTPSPGGNIGDERRQREGCDFNPLIAGLRDERKRCLQRPLLEDLVADGPVHSSTIGGSSRGINPIEYSTSVRCRRKCGSGGCLAGVDYGVNLVLQPLGKEIATLPEACGTMSNRSVLRPHRGRPGPRDCGG